MNKHAD